MFVERDGKIVVWTWAQYHADSMKFAKSMCKLGVTQRSSVAIMGFNSPEWVIAYVGAIMNNCVATGVYTTNGPEACHY